MRFLFVRPEFCPLGDLSTPKIRLSSDSTSRWTPLPLASPSRYRADSGLSPYRTCAHRAHISKRPGQMSGPQQTVKEPAQLKVSEGRKVRKETVRVSFRVRSPAAAAELQNHALKIDFAILKAAWQKSPMGLL